MNEGVHGRDLKVGNNGHLLLAVVQKVLLDLLQDSFKGGSLRGEPHRNVEMVGHYSNVGVICNLKSCCVEPKFVVRHRKINIRLLVLLVGD